MQSDLVSSILWLTLSLLSLVLRLFLFSSSVFLSY